MNRTGGRISNPSVTTNSTKPRTLRSRSRLAKALDGHSKFDAFAPDQTSVPISFCDVIKRFWGDQSLITAAMNKEAQRHKTSKKELDNMRALIARDLADASLAGLSADRRFATAYNAALQAANMAIACAGYRIAWILLDRADDDLPVGLLTAWVQFSSSKNPSVWSVTASFACNTTFLRLASVFPFPSQLWDRGCLALMSTS